MKQQNGSIIFICSFKNEEVAAPTFIAELLELLASSKLKYKLILIDDGSNDQTAEYLNEFTRTNIKLLTLNRNIGKIAAQAVGALKYDDGLSDLVFFDGDGQHHPQEILKVIESGRKVSRITVGKRTNQYKRRNVSKMGTLLLKSVFGLLGIKTNLQNSELVYVPSSHVRQLLADTDFGFLPINIILAKKDLNLIPIKIHPRVNMSPSKNISRHANSELMRKGLIQVYSQPLKMLYRLVFFGGFPVFGAFCYGTYIGINSLLNHDPSGVGSIILIMSFSTVTLLLLGVILFGFLIVINEWFRSRIAIERELK
jgi:glycosyltransferase involved in cell wall biosynthesis